MNMPSRTFLFVIVFVGGFLPASLFALTEINVSQMPASVQEAMEKARAQAKAQEGATDDGAPAAKKKAVDPKAERLSLLKKITIDRTHAGMMQARLAAAQDEEPEVEHADEEETPEEPKEPPTPEELEVAAFKERLEQFNSDLNLGNWNEVGVFLGALEDKEAEVAYERMLEQLSTQVTVTPRAELAAAGAMPYRQSQWLRASDVLALANMAPKELEKGALLKLSNLLKQSDAPTNQFFTDLEKNSTYFGRADDETSLRTALFLMDGGYLAEAKPYLPKRDAAEKSADYTALNLLARWYADAHHADEEGDNLPVAWEVSLHLVSANDAPFAERGEALYRALGLIPDLEDEAGKEWLDKTFGDPRGEGFTILSAVGSLTAQVRQHRSASYRLEQIKLQRSAAEALLNTPDIDPDPWREILTFYVRNWLHEANHSQKYDRATSMRPQRSFDSFGNLYYTPSSRSMGARTTMSQKVMPAIDTGDLLRERPNDQWMAIIDEPVRVEAIAIAARLFLKVKEHEEALPLLGQLAPHDAKETKELLREMIRVWAENNNPNQQTRYRSSYYYYSGYNQRAQTIPLTRSKQERNLKQLAHLMQEVRALKLDEEFDEEFSDAFIQCHSQAEVWRLEALETVFGDLKTLKPKTAASLLRRMRANLANLWPNPKLQEEAKTKRKDKELQAQMLEGYAAAETLCEDVLEHHPDHWALEIQLAALQYEASNYRAVLGSHPKHSANKRASLDALAEACATYTATLPLEDKSDESDEPFTTWFFAALGSPDLAALKSHHQPVAAEFAKIKAALEAVPERSRERHQRQFARTLNSRVANVGADLKYRFLEAALSITGEHEQIADAASIFEYYQDLVTEIELDVRIDGPDNISATTPFGLFVNLRHTREIERESGGFQRYLINQTNSRYSYNYGRPTEDYRDKFEKAARAALEEHFEIVSVTFHHSKVQSRTDAEPGWSMTPYGYLLLKPKGAEVDTIPPLKIDLDFLDTSGYVVLPIASAAIPVSAVGAGGSRPHRNLKVTMTLDEREAEESGKVILEVKASAHGLVPPLERLVGMAFADFDVTSMSDNELLIAELDAETDDGAPVSTREWRLVLEPKGDEIPSEFTFPALEKNLSLASEDGLVLQQYDDVDLVPVTASVLLGSGGRASGGRSIYWLLLLPLLVFLVWCEARQKNKLSHELLVVPDLPSTLTPVTAIAFLNRVLDSADFDESMKVDLASEIEELEARSFGPRSTPPTVAELEAATVRWQQMAGQRRQAA